MENLKILPKKEIKPILNLLKEQFDAKFDSDYVFLMNRKNRIYIVNREIGKLDLTKFRINSIGLYLGELRNNELRLSIEASQLIGPNAKKNILELNQQACVEWLQGKDLDIDVEEKGYKILKHNDDFIGCGKAVQNKIPNFVPKNRRLTGNDPNI